MRPVITTTSSNAIQEQESALDTQLQDFQSIGKGLCDEVFEKVGTGRVYKRELNQNDGGLWNDYKIHTSIYDAIILEKSKPGAASVENFPKLHVPQVYSFTTREDNAWWKENCENFARISSSEYTNGHHRCGLLMLLEQELPDHIAFYYCRKPPCDQKRSQIRLLSRSPLARY